MNTKIIVIAVVAVAVIAAVMWFTREKFSQQSQDPLAPGRTGPNAKPVMYNQGSNRQRPTITIASSMSKFRPKSDGKCPAGYSVIVGGSRDGLCIKSEYAGRPRASNPSRSSSPSRKSSGSGSMFTSKVNGKCPSGTVEITSGGHKGECYKGGSSGGSSRRSSGGSSRRSSGGSSSSRGSNSGSTNYGSKFVGKSNGRCPSGTTEITAGSRKGQCIRNAAKENIEYNRKNVGSIYKGRESASCPKGMTLIKSGDRKGMCIDEGKVIDRTFPYWGWGPNAGLKCRNNDNTGCNTKYDGGRLVSREKKLTLADKYPFWGWSQHAGLRCKNNDNTGCNTKYVGGKLVEA
jgi:hypothetical protein